MVSTNKRDVMVVERNIGPLSIRLRATWSGGFASVGNRHRTGEKVGVAWRLPRLHIGGYVSGGEDRDGGGYMDAHKHNVRLGA